MVKGGTKRKIPIKKIEKIESLRTTFSKRSNGLFSKASQLCLLSGSQIAILATPPSSESFYSFGHSSVDAVISAFLEGKRLESDNKEMREDVGICMARKDLGLKLWWENERFDNSKDPREIKDALESMSILLKSLKELKVENNKTKTKETDLVFNQEPVQTLNTEELDQIFTMCENFCGADNAMDICKLVDFDTSCDNSQICDVGELVV